MNDLMYDRVAVAIDGSPAADAAVDFALGFVAKGGELAFVHAVDRRTVSNVYGADPAEYYDALASLDHYHDAIFNEARQRASARGIFSTRNVVYGPAVEAVPEFVHRDGADALVLGVVRNAGSARRWLGCRPGRILRNLNVPAIVTPAAGCAGANGHLQRILVATDASWPTAKAVDCAIGLALRNGADITFAHVAEALLERRTRARIVSAAAQEFAERTGVRADVVTLHGFASEAINGAATALGADLIVLGTHRRLGEERRRTPSIAAEVARGAVCPVMVIPVDAELAATG